MPSACDILEAPAARPRAHAFADDVRTGLARRPKTLSSTYFYDERGSQLFQQITEQEDYYLTRCEREILEDHGDDIARSLAGDPLQVVEIGAGDGHKTEVLLQALIAAGLALEYVPIDICREAVVELVGKLRGHLNGHGIPLRGIVADYYDAFPLLRKQPNVRKLALFLGSSIGNFGQWQAVRFLRKLRQALATSDSLLIGFDLKKDLQVLHRAYDDAAGVTREFNFNLLDRINRELGGQFDRRRFHHHATYNLRLGCMESWLVSRERQRVPIRALPATIAFDAWEGIRIERSYKYDLAQIESLAAESGFQVRQHFFDRRGYFVDSLWDAM